MAAQGDAEITKLYEYSAILDGAGVDILKYQETFNNILKAVNGGVKAKKLTAQLIPRYFKHFPALHENAVSALTDLCEEEETDIRIMTVKGFPQLCKETPAVLPRISDVLAQLLQTSIPVELDNVKTSLVSLLRLQPQAVIHTLFTLIGSKDDHQKEAAISFLKDKVWSLRTEVLQSPVVQQFLAECIRKNLNEVNSEEFVVFLDLLSSLSIYQGEAVKDLLDMTTEVKSVNTSFITKLVPIINTASSCGKRGVTSTKFLQFLSEKVLPEQVPENVKYELFKAIANMSPFTNADDARILLPGLYPLLLQQLPAEEKSKTNFSNVECLLYAFHQLGGKAPGFLRHICGFIIRTGQPADDDLGTSEMAAKLKEFQARLKQLNDLVDKSIKEMNQGADANKKNSLALILRTTKNVKELVVNLLKPKPVFVGEQVSLSFKSGKTTAPITPTTGAKRKAESETTANPVKQVQQKQKQQQQPQQKQQQPQQKQQQQSQQKQQQQQKQQNGKEEKKANAKKSQPQGLYVPPQKRAGSDQNKGKRGRS